MLSCALRRAVGVLSLAMFVALAGGAASFVAHDPGAGVFGETGDITQREPEKPREAEATSLWIKTGPSFSYDAVAVYYTLDGTPPAGTHGSAGNPSTHVLTSGAGQIQFVRNEPGQSGNDDWWRADLPADARLFGATVRYLVSAYGPGGAEVFATDASDGDNTFEYANLLAWPGAGSGSANPGEGYPPLHFWKEEAVAGNGSINTMLDQNGSLYDIYCPSAGAVNGVSTKNEGYFDNFQDQFPASLQPGQRGQMHLNQAFVGLRPTNPATGEGTTYWLTNATGSDYVGVSQHWDGDSDVIVTEQTLVAGGHNLKVTQTDFAPRGIAFPTTNGGDPNRGLHIKRVSIKNQGASTAEVNVYFFADWALNGGDQFDGAFADESRGAMVFYDNTHRFVNGAGEYNPSTFSDYEKNVSVYLAAAIKVNGGPARGFWSDTSNDQGEGWIGDKITINPGQTKSFGLYIVGGFDDFAGATGTYAAQQAPVIDQLFNAGSITALSDATRADWESWLDQGVSFTCPDTAYNELFKRGLIGTALHLDDKNGGIIAGMHNGAYPYVWPRDAAWAAITLARTGHIAEAENIFHFLRDVAYRDIEGWGRKGFWKQKYTTDGYTIWGSPQVDETSCYPWGVRSIFDITGDLSFLEDHYDEVYEAAIASSQDSTVDSRLRYEESVDLMYSMSLWEDSFDVFNYSNASVVRGLEDAAAIADTLDQQSCPGGPGTCNYHNDEALFQARANAIRGGLDARLAWNGENTDISQLGITYPFEIYPAGSPRPQLILDRINGFAPDAFGNIHPLLRDGSIPEWAGLVDRYWNDGYWNGGPWFLTTLWFGAYHAERQGVNPGTADIDVHKQKLDLLIGHLGPMGFGAEQIADYSNVLYAGQADYTLQTAFPNAWESMSFLTDAIMLFLGYEPDAGSILRIKPKLPSDWSSMSFGNLPVGDSRVDVLVEGHLNPSRHTFTNRTGDPLPFETTIRFEPIADASPVVEVNGVQAPAAPGPTSDSLIVTGTLVAGVGAETVVEVTFVPDCAADVAPPYGVLDLADINAFITGFLAHDPIADIDGNGIYDLGDINGFVQAFVTGCAAP
ncbi:MAG: hypothetical protein H6810_08785 [Phycisphaeraceae bacterium]|nr:MAG: hypothetical protein H6810_08785 [Phycisphaeraceae bacterium]